METIAIVTADAKSRVPIRGVNKGTRFRLSREGDRFFLDTMKEEAPRPRIVRENGRLVVDTRRAITQEEINRLLEEFP